MEKTCNTCLFAAGKITSYPCSVCIDNGRWQYNGLTYTREEVEKYLIRFCDSIKDYEHESKNLIGFDERECIEFVKIFLEKEANNG